MRTLTRTHHAHVQIHIHPHNIHNISQQLLVLARADNKRLHRMFAQLLHNRPHLHRLRPCAEKNTYPQKVSSCIGVPNLNLSRLFSQPETGSCVFVRWCLWDWAEKGMAA